jgi:hypothetical protein
MNNLSTILAQSSLKSLVMTAHVSNARRMINTRESIRQTECWLLLQVYPLDVKFGGDVGGGCVPGVVAKSGERNERQCMRRLLLL